MQLLKIGHYEPPIETTGGNEADISPEIPCPKFDNELKDPLLGRIVLKAVSNTYLERA